MAFQMNSHKGGIKEINAEQFITEISGRGWSIMVPIAPGAPISGFIYLGLCPDKGAALARVEGYLDSCISKDDDGEMRETTPPRSFG
jgi:hypothetical protein